MMLVVSSCYIYMTIKSVIFIITNEKRVETANMVFIVLCLYYLNCNDEDRKQQKLQEPQERSNLVYSLLVQ